MFFNKKESELLRKIERTNSEELLFWKLPNVFYPFTVIGLSFIAFFIFKSQDKITFINVINLLFNGSLPLVALNRMSSLGVNLFKFDKSKETSLKTNTLSLRLKIDSYSKLLVFLIAFLYIYQVVNTPFNTSWWLWLQLTCSVFFIYYSIGLSKYAYLLQEKMIETTVGDIIREEANEAKKHLSEKYGD